MTHLQSNECSSVDCAAPAVLRVALVDMDGEAFPYCDECAAVLLRGGEKLAGVIDPVTDEMVERACAAVWGDGWAELESLVGGYFDAEKRRKWMRTALAAAFSTKEEPTP